jgi:hypothetical protein
MRKTLAMIGLPLLLGGCGLPPALTVASWALDGVSYAISGKSVTDHAISEVAQQDCALLRVVQGREICDSGNPEDGGTVMVAAAPSGENWSVSAELPSRGDPLEVPPELAGFVAGFAPGVVAVDQRAAAVAGFAPASFRWSQDTDVQAHFVNAAPKHRPDAPRPVTPVIEVVPLPEAASPGQWANTARDVAATRNVSVVGSFRSIDNAWDQAAQFAALGAEVRSARIGGQTWHRVVVDAPLATVQRMGAADAWILKVCDADGSLPPCGPTTVSSAGVFVPHTVSAN